VHEEGSLLHNSGNLLLFLLLLLFLGLVFARLDIPLPLPSQVRSSGTQDGFAFARSGHPCASTILVQTRA
jgi:hypothetical protein